MLAYDRRTLWQNNECTGFFDNRGNKGHFDLSPQVKSVGSNDYPIEDQTLITV